MKNNSEQSWSEQTDFSKQTGFANDVIDFSSTRICRNLANFPFSENLSFDDKMQVQSLFFDAFSKIQSENPNHEFNAINTSNVDDNVLKILQERGILNYSDSNKKNNVDATGVIIEKDSSFNAVINSFDHIRFSSFRNGLDIKNTYKDCAFIDSKLQDYLQFAASYDFGYHTASLLDVGTGMNLSALIHIPGIILSGKLKIITDYLSEKKIFIKPAFPELSKGSVAGSFYLITTINSMFGTELDQSADFESICLHIAEVERKILADYAENKRTVAFNSLLRAYSIANFSMLISLSESIEIISQLKMGLRNGFITGIEEGNLSSLLFKVQPYHLKFLLKDGNFSFEKDILNDEKGKIDRLRAVLLQDAIQKISLRNL